MGENYGTSFAAKLISQEKYEEAIEAASKDAVKDPADPQPVYERGVACSALGRYADAVADLERAIELDREEAMLETDFVDDALFGALLGEARASKDVAFGVARLERYRALFPRGRHAADVDLWSGRLRGEGQDGVIVKERLS